MTTLNEFTVSAVDGGTEIKSAVMEFAAASAGLPVDRRGPGVIHVDPKGRSLVFQDMNGPSSSAVARYLCDNKIVARRLLSAAGLRTARSGAFALDDRDHAWELAATMPGKVVVKPIAEAMSRGITTGIEDHEAFVEAWERASSYFRPPHVTPTRLHHHALPPRVIVEEQCEGEDFRVFVVGDRVVSVTQRRRASVHGDGQRTVSELIAHKNQARAANPGLRNYPIPTDPALLDQLATSGYHLHDIPPAGHHLTLRSVSNLSAGGDSIDVTDQTHPAVNALAVRAVRAIPGLAYAGVDLITPSVTQPPDDVGYVISEIEFSPGPMSHFPAEGTPRDMAGAVLDHYLTTPTTR